MLTPSEADARINIDQLLREAGWDPADKQQVRTEVPITILSEASDLAEITTGSQRLIDEPLSPPKKADYVLHTEEGRPLAVIEAKKNAIDPYRAKNQALPYARAIGAPFIFLSNGDAIYFWDYENSDARPVASFYSRRDLARLLSQRKNSKDLSLIPIEEDYMRAGEIRFLRPYQHDCMSALDSAFLLGKRRFLIELPTGTGKTDLTVLYMKRLLKAGHAERILVLVDRESLAKQALETIQDLLPECSSYWLKAGTAPQHKQITVCLLQTMMSRFRSFTSGYFDLVVTDEAHRSIYGAWRESLEYFDAFHIGLTATPAKYIERNTYQFYHCQGEQPDFSYPIEDAFQNSYLVPYTFAEGITAAQTSDPVIAKIKSGEDLTDEEQDSLSLRLNENENYFNEENLRNAYRTPAGTIIDFIRAALGLVTVKSREEQIDENFRAWLVSHQFTPEQAVFLSLLKNRGIANGHIELSELFEPPLIHSNAPEKAQQLFGPAIKEIVAEMNDSVFTATA